MKRRVLSQAEQRDWVRLARTENVGPVTFRELIRRFGAPSAALEALPQLSRKGGRIAPLHMPNPAQIEDELAAGQRLGARLVAACEPGFPARLAALDPPPPLIWTRGDAALLHRPAVAVVGARIASAAGQRFAGDLARDLGSAGFVVVSGLARGIDRAAHEGSLSTGAVAMVAGGVDHVFPPEHADLYERMVAKGCVVSERAPGAIAKARDFPRRNRLISGLSLAVVVVEAELRSGSLITARLAAEQGREVLAVPGSPLDPRAKGTNDLIRQGAALCEGVDDVLRALGGISGLREPDADPWRREDGGEDADAGLLKQLAALVSPTPVTRDELARLTGCAMGAVSAALIELALGGRVELLEGGLVVAGNGAD